MDIVSRNDDEEGQVLAAFIADTSETVNGCKVQSARISAIRQDLALRLPEYMIPSIFVSMKAIPLTTSGKVDRQQLRLVAQNLTQEEFLSATGKSSARVPPEGKMEKQLQQLWADVLGSSEERISMSMNPEP